MLGSCDCSYYQWKYWSYVSSSKDSELLRCKGWRALWAALAMHT